MLNEKKCYYATSGQLLYTMNGVDAFPDNLEYQGC
jgi:hypothetical protein